MYSFFFFFQAEDGIRDKLVTGVQTCALPIYLEEVEVIQTQARASPQDLGLALARRLPLLHLEQPVAGAGGRDRERVVWGERGDFGGGRVIKKKKKKNKKHVRR